MNERGEARVARGRWISLLAVLAVIGAGIGCDHDPTVLETHPLDVTGATSASLQSFYLTMSDGVRIAVDVAVPDNHPSGMQLPSIIELTRYWRRRGESFPTRPVGL